MWLPRRKSGFWPAEGCGEDGLVLVFPGGVGAFQDCPLLYAVSGVGLWEICCAPALWASPSCLCSPRTLPVGSLGFPVSGPGAQTASWAKCHTPKGPAGTADPFLSFPGQEPETPSPLRHPLHVRGQGVPAQEADREEGELRLSSQVSVCVCCGGGGGCGEPCVAAIFLLGAEKLGRSEGSTSGAAAFPCLLPPQVLLQGSWQGLLTALLGAHGAALGPCWVRDWAGGEGPYPELGHDQMLACGCQRSAHRSVWLDHTFVGDGRSESQGNVMDALPSLKPSQFLSRLLCYGVLVGEKVAPRGAAKCRQSALSDGLGTGGRLTGWHVCLPQSTDQQAPRQPREAVSVGVRGFPVLHETALAGSG